MKNTLPIFHLTATALCVMMMIGCGSSEQTVALQTHLATTDSLQREINGLKSQTGSLKDQISKLDLEKQIHLIRIAYLESTVTALREQLTAVPPTPAKPQITDTRAAYQHALELFRSRQYGEAASILQSLLDAGVTPTLEDNCHYWLGECAFGSKSYADAIAHFQKVFTFKISEKKDESQIMIARSYAAMGNKARAKAEYQKLIDTYPASPYLARAKEQMARY